MARKPNRIFATANVLSILLLGMTMALFGAVLVKTTPVAGVAVVLTGCFVCVAAGFSLTKAHGRPR